MKDQHVVRVMWALGTMRMMDDMELYTALTERIMQLLPGFSEQVSAPLFCSHVALGSSRFSLSVYIIAYDFPSRLLPSQRGCCLSG